MIPEITPIKTLYYSKAYETYEEALDVLDTVMGAKIQNGMKVREKNYFSDLEPFFIATEWKETISNGLPSREPVSGVWVFNIYNSQGEELAGQWIAEDPSEPQRVSK